MELCRENPRCQHTHDVYTEKHEAALSPIAWAASSPFSFAFVTGPEVLKETGCVLKEMNCTLVQTPSPVLKLAELLQKGLL